MAVGVFLSGAMSAQKDGPTNKEKIVGTWKLVKASSPNAIDVKAVGGTYEFTKEGKFSVADKDGNNGGVSKATYEVEGDKLKIKFKLTIGLDKEVDRTLTLTIKTLTDKEMVLEEKKDDKTRTAEFKRVK
jgi:uncharacterized protein (TIGR03066 family)